MFEFSKEEFDELVYAAREATIRFKRARTEFRKGNPAYLNWGIDELNERIIHYSNLEEKLKGKYQAEFGEVW